MIPDIKIRDYFYPLTEDRIAKYPLPCRDASKLLVYNDGKVEEDCFRNIASHLPSGSLLVFNDTKVVPARLFFRRETGARIEVFCLEPVFPVEYNTNFAATESCRWRCVIGNSKRWGSDIINYDVPDGNDSALELRKMNFRAALISKGNRTGEVEFRWEGGATFSRVLELCGKVPIPPYLNRDTEAIDLERYQTLYARVSGSVAAPTAGLHFTDRVLDEIRAKGVDTERICLHVGAGTFLPVKSECISGHPMHREPFVVRRDFLRKLIDATGKIIAVGTTSVRTLESLFYVGVNIIEQGRPLDVGQWAPYDRDYSYSTREALEAIVNYLDENSLDALRVGTRIIIVPGFKFRVVDMMVTNFHQSESTLILLVSAFVGGDWRTIYDYALAHEFRFLSYGDSSLLFRRDG